MPVARLIVITCWTIFAIVWIVAAFFTKRTVERHSRFSPIVILAVLEAVVIVPIVRKMPALEAIVIPQTLATHLLSIALSIGGLVFTLWARSTLGRNWSGTVTFKEGHELIQQGPYALVRHPIYTGFLAMVLASVLIIGTPNALLLVLLVAAVLWLKIRQEERMMTKHFPEVYPGYRARVKALVPFLF